MGVYNKELKMPKHCGVCHFMPLCKAVGRRIETKERHKNCPLIEVKEPHGDLIDKSRVYDETRIYADYVQSLVLRIVDCAPTVIKAESK